MKQKEKEFEIVKEEQSDKRNYIFQKNSITKNTFYFIVFVLAILIAAVIIVSGYLG